MTATTPTPTFSEGVKFDAGKLRYGLIPVQALEELARVFTVGATKYEPWNWAKGMDWTRVSDAMERHLAEWKKGVTFDQEKPEQRLRHLAQVAWGAFVLLEYERLGIGKDDRQGRDVLPSRNEGVVHQKITSFDASLAQRAEAADMMSAGIKRAESKAERVEPSSAVLEAHGLLATVQVPVTIDQKPAPARPCPIHPEPLAGCLLCRGVATSTSP